MAITEDASTPAVHPQTGTGTNTSASFSPPANSLLVALVAGGWSSTQPLTAAISDSGGHTWTAAVTATGTVATTGGVAKIFYTYLSTAPGATTVTATFTGFGTGADSMLAVRVLNGADSNQAAAATATLVNSTSTTSGTISITTTVTGSQVYGVIDEPSISESSYSLNGATSLVATTPVSGFYTESGAGISIAAWKATSTTGTPGATTLGGTWPTADRSNIVAFEALPVATTTSPATASLAGVGSLTATAAITGPPRVTMAAVATLTATPTQPTVLQFPQAPRTITVEMFLNGGWVDITADVYARDKISITRGGQDETSRIGPSRCSLTLNNRTGKYSPRNPSGIYYGSVGRNTPLRVSVGKNTDTFSRTVSSGWGPTNNGNVWSIIGTASNFNVSPGAGTVSLPGAGNQIAYIRNQAYGDVSVAVTGSLSLVSVTGDIMEPNGIILRGIDANNYTLAFVYISEITGHYFLVLYQLIAGVFTNLAADFDTGITYVSGQAITVRAQIENIFVRAKLWAANSTEPYDWQVSGFVDGAVLSGWVGVYSAVGSGNTNTKPIVCTYNKVVVSVPRYAGEVAYWPQRWDISGRDIYVPIEASGIKRRLGQGASPLDSAMRTKVLSLPTAPVAYWPCEEGSNATQISALIGGNQMRVSGVTKFADFSGFVCSSPLPTLNGGTWTGRVQPYATSGYMGLRYLLHMSSSEPPDTWPITQLFTTGTASQWEIKYRTGSRLQINAWSPGGLLFDSGLLGFAPGDTLLDRLWMLDLVLHQNGANIDYNLRALQVSGPTSQGWTGTLASQTLGTANKVVVDPYKKMSGVSVGHITVRNGNADIFDTSAGLNAFGGPPDLGGETAKQRIFTLGNNAGVLTDARGTFTDTSALVGARRPLPLLTILEDAAEADGGLLFETRGLLGLTFRTLRTLYNQAATLTLNYSAGQVAPPLEPVDDDLNTHNDVIAKRTDGGTFELFLSSGRLSTLNPWSGGVGRYTDEVTRNVNADGQLPDVAGFELLLGTVDEARYPTIAVNLANPNVTAAGVDNAAMSVNVGDRIVVTNPPAFSTVDQIAQIVRGYTETLSVFEHTISFVCAPASPYEVIRAGTAGKMTLDSAGSTLASSVTTTATSLSVAIAAGHSLWITGTVSFDLALEGERITVTNISGASSPQTFTVARSVNGVVKTHAAGVAVRLFRPSLLAR